MVDRLTPTPSFMSIAGADLGGEAPMAEIERSVPPQVALRLSRSDPSMTLGSMESSGPSSHLHWGQSQATTKQYHISMIAHCYCASVLS